MGPGIKMLFGVHGSHDNDGRHVYIYGKTHSRIFSRTKKSMAMWREMQLH